MNYQEIMSQSKEKTFTDLYEMLDNYVREYDLSPDIIIKLREKRDFGRNKYKDFSFQSSFTNAMTTPIHDHLYEEVIDALNYCLHEKFVLGLTAPEKLETVSKIIFYLKNILFYIERLKED